MRSWWMRKRGYVRCWQCWRWYFPWNDAERERENCGRHDHVWQGI